MSDPGRPERNGCDVVIAGIGSEHRHDDAVGLIVSEQVAQAIGARCVAPVVDPLDLLGRWDDADLAVVVDAVHSGAEPGTVELLFLGPDAEIDHDPPSRRRRGPTSSHGVDVVGVHRLARAVGRAPGRVVVVGIEGEDFSPGLGLSPRVRAAVPTAVRRVLTLVEEVVPCA